MAYKKMLVAEWIAVEDNPIQRDTERHAAKAKHLLTPHPTHSFVFAAELPSGKLVKLDGHTRALLWKRGEVPAPAQVQVALIQVKDRAEAEKLYKDFDSREALETMRDRVSGAFNRHNFDPQSGLVQAGNITSALRIAYSVLLGSTASQGAASSTTSRLPRADVYLMIDEFSNELHMLDGFGLNQGRLQSGGVAAFILSARRYGHKVTPFWRGVFGNAGEKSGGQMDAVQAVCELLIGRRGNYGGSASYDLCARVLGGIEKWMRDELMFRIPSPLNTAGYLAGHEKPTERLIKRADIGRKVA